MITSIQKLVDEYTYQKNSCDNPSTYQEQEYYDRCKIKSEVLGDVISDLKQLLVKEAQTRSIIESYR